MATLMGEAPLTARYRVPMRVEPVTPSLYGPLGELTVAAYRGLAGRPTSDQQAQIVFLRTELERLK